MPFQSDLVYRDRDTILAELIAQLQARIPNAAISEDTVWRILFEVLSGSIEGLFMALQLLHNDMFIQTAEAVALVRYGDEYGVPEKPGTLASGIVTFAGDGGTYIPIGTEVAAPQASDDSLLFTTTADGTLPNPGSPTAPTVADRVLAGNLTGTYEWAITFVTSVGETEIGDASAALVLAASQAALTNIPIGGTGTTKRRVYRMKNGGNWQFAWEIPDNATTAWNDNITDGALGGPPPASSTAEQISLAAQAEDAGTGYNVLVGTITDISSSVPGLTSVTNAAVFTGGSDPEDTEDYRSRLLDYIRNPKSGSPADLESWAETIPGVESATAFTNDNMGVATPGHTTVRISGPNGTLPDAATQAAVLAELQSHDLANITIHVTTFVAHNVASDVTLTILAGFVLADVSPSAAQAITDYINSVPVGGTVYRAGIYDAVFGLPGIATLVVNTPAADVAMAATEKPVPSPAPVIH
jgi:uncharacterized phage protein gp47/JayE